MRVTRWGEYGILCCMYLAKQMHQSTGGSSTAKVGAPRFTAVGAAEIAEAQKIPLQYAQQILHRLRKGGVIQSVRGPRGGYSLTRPPEQISLRDILLAAEGETFQIICEDDPVYKSGDPDGAKGRSGCREAAALGACGLSAVWRDLKRAIDDVLERRSLASVIEQVEPPLVTIQQGSSAATESRRTAATTTR